jgi:uncharacterized protein (TIGR03083 family)
MALSLDHLAIVEGDAERIRVAYDTDRGGRIPWSDRWTVRSVARHVAAAHHVAAGIVRGRPAADFGLLDGMEQPARDDPGFPGWFVAGTEALGDALRACDLDEPCWTSIPAGRTVHFWLRRIAAETLVHRWDAEVGAGIDPAPFDTVGAVDGVDEYLTLAAPYLREVRRSPGGPSVRISCTDAEASWSLRFADGGGCIVDDTPVPGATELRGPAGGLLLALYGRRPFEDAGVEVRGDPSVVERWDELIPAS